MTPATTASGIVRALRAAHLHDATRSELLRLACDRIRALGAPYTSVYAYMLSGDELVLEAFSGRDTPHTRIPVGRGVCGTAVATGRDQSVPDVTAAGNYLACNLETKSELVVLIRRGATILGLLLQHRDPAREQRVLLEPHPRRHLARRVVPGEHVPPRRRELHHLAGRRHPAELLGAAHDRGHSVVVHAQVLGQLEHGPPPVRTRRQVVEEPGHLRHVHPRERDEPLRSRCRLRLRQQGG